MAKREMSITGNKERDAIMTKVDELNDLVIAYFNKFEKTTEGQKSIGELGYKFVETCAGKILLFPEILSATFNQADFVAKQEGAADFFAFKKRLFDGLLQWETSAKICKTDAMFYANDYYNILKREAKNGTKYKPTFSELTPFYKKSSSEKVGAKKALMAKKEATPVVTP